MAISSENKRVLITLPADILFTVDKHIKNEHITRTKWFVDAALDKIKKDNKKRIDEIVSRK